MTTFNDTPITTRQIVFISKLLMSKEVPSELMKSTEEVLSLTKREAWEFTQELIDLPKRFDPRDYEPGPWDTDAFIDDESYHMDHSSRLDRMGSGRSWLLGNR